MKAAPDYFAYWSRPEHDVRHQLRQYAARRPRVSVFKVLGEPSGCWRFSEVLKLPIGMPGAP